MCGCSVCLWVGLGRVLIVVIACAHTYKTLARFFSCMQVVELANAWSQDKDCLYMSGTMKFYKGSPLFLLTCRSLAWERSEGAGGSKTPGASGTHNHYKLTIIILGA